MKMRDDVLFWLWVVLGIIVISGFIPLGWFPVIQYLIVWLLLLMHLGIRAWGNE